MSVLVVNFQEFLQALLIAHRTYPFAITNGSVTGTGGSVLRAAVRASGWTVAVGRFDREAEYFRRLLTTWVMLKLRYPASYLDVRRYDPMSQIETLSTLA